MRLVWYSKLHLPVFVRTTFALFHEVYYICHMTQHHMKTWRTNRGWSLQTAADALGCAKRTIQAYESGRSRIPRYIALAIAAIQHDLPEYGRNQP